MLNMVGSCNRGLSVWSLCVRVHVCVSMSVWVLSAGFLYSNFFKYLQGTFVQIPRNANTAHLAMKIYVSKVQKKKVRAPKFQLVLALQFSDLGVVNC